MKTRPVSLAVAVSLVSLGVLATSSACGPKSAVVAPTPADPNPQPIAPAKPAADDPAPPELRLDPAVAAPLAYRLTLAIDPNADTFTGTVEIDVQFKTATDHLWLNGDDIEFNSAHVAVQNRTIPARALSTSKKNFFGIGFGEKVGPGPAIVRVNYSGKIDTKGVLGVFKQQDRGNWYQYTQFEALGARKAFPSFDEPSFKVPFEITLRVPSELMAFANTPVASEKVEDKWKTVRFKKSKPMPTYLVAFAVGPFEIVDLGKSGRAGVQQRILVPKGHTDEVAFVRKSAPELLKRLEDYFDMAYPYRKLDHIALPNFFGAMENPGLITYASSILLRKAGDESEGWYKRHSNVVAHEIAHQWFGNLVTLAWWNDIWLNESFATWLAMKVVAQWKPGWETTVDAIGRRSGSMSSDSMASSRKVRREIKNTGDIYSAFDAISYGKGAAVIAMFESWIGEDKFRDGMRQYMRKHAWKTATSEDFLASLAAVSAKDLPPAFSTFLDQSGVPLVALELSCLRGRKPTVKVAQSRFVVQGSKAKSDQTWSIPLCVKYGVGSAQERQCQLVSAAEQSIELAKARRCPDYVVGNADAAGYYRVDHRGDLLKRIVRAGRKLSTQERMSVLSDVNALAQAGKVELGVALDLIPSLLRDRNHHIVTSAAGIASSIEPMVTAKRRANYKRFLSKTFGKRARALGWLDRKGDSRATLALRRVLVPLVAVGAEDAVLGAEADKLARKWLADHSAIPSKNVSAVLGAAAYRGDTALYEKFLAGAKTEKDRTTKQRFLGALGSFRKPELVKRSMKLLLSKDFSLQEASAAVQGSMRHAELRPIVYQFIKDNYDPIAAKLPPMAQGYLVFTAVPFCDEKHKKDAKEFFEPRLEKTGSTRMLEQALEQMDLCIAQKKAQQPQVDKFLRKY